MPVVTMYNGTPDEEILHEATRALWQYRTNLPESVVELFIELSQRYEDALDSLRDPDVKPVVADATGAP